MGRAGLIFALAASLGAAPVTASALSFDGARLGMTIGEWRSLAPPQGIGQDALAACSNDPRISQVAHNPLSGADKGAGAVTCSYVDLFAHAVLPRPFRLDPSYRASDLQYLFDHGRLREVRFGASIDAFDDAMAMLERQYGAPTATARDSVRTPDGAFARVTETWRTPDGEIGLVDPARNPTQLEISFTAASGPTHQSR